jgi:hypothetical protein
MREVTVREWRNWQTRKIMILWGIIRGGSNPLFRAGKSQKIKNAAKTHIAIGDFVFRLKVD